MRKIIIPVLMIFFCLSRTMGICYEIRAKVEIKEKQLKQIQPIARAELPFPRNGYIFVTDKDGLKVQSVYFPAKDKQTRCSVYFKTNKSDIYYVYYLSEERSQDTSLANQIQDGKVLIDDYLNPSARTSGFWFWTTKPSLSGRFSHTGRISSKINSHYTSIVPGEKIKSSDILYQSIFIKGDEAPSEIMIEVQAKGKPSCYFSWGLDVIKWKNLRKISMGQIPEAEKWVRLVIPTERIGKDIEITGIGFYNAGGRVYWDYTTIGSPVLETKVIEWRKEGKKISAFFDYDIFGPFTFSDKTFNIVNFNASASRGINTYQWQINGKKYTGSNIFTQIEKKPSIYAKLICFNTENKQSKTFSETIVLPDKTPESINLITRIMPHRNVVNTGQIVFIPVQISSLMYSVVPVDILTDNQIQHVKILPGKDNSVMMDLFFKPSENKSMHSIETRVGETIIDSKKVILSSIDDVETKILQGPYIKNENGDTIIVSIPEYKFSLNNSKSNTEKEIYLFIGDIPDGFIEIIKKNLPDVDLRWLKYPESKETYHALSNLFWIKNISENINADTIVLFPSVNSILSRTPVDEWTTCLDGIVYCLSKHTNNIICATPFPSAPISEMFKPYADATVNLCKKRNIGCFNLYDVYTKITDWERFFSDTKGIYKNLPSGDGIQILTDAFLEMIGITSEKK